MLKKLVFAALLVLQVFVLCPVASAQMDDSNRNLLIEKLDRVYQNLALNDSSKVAVTLRLADLYAERARIYSMKELEGDCGECKIGAQDRQKALKLYTEVLDRAPESVQAKVMIQVGHLYQMVGDETKALQFYQKILKNKLAPELQAEAQLSQAEIYFKRRDFVKAQSLYQEVVKNQAASSRGLAAYRDAWCFFNMGDTRKAVEQTEVILKTPSLLTRSGSAGTQVDPQFQEEVSRDYGTFIAKNKIEKDRVESLFQLSPQSAKVANVRGLALEAERLGKKDDALLVWNFIYPHMSKPEDRLAAKISMAQLLFDTSRKNEAATTYESAMDLWQDLKTCNNSECEELRRRSRQFVVAWNQVEKKDPSPELLTAYQNYLKNFPQDIDMHIYRGQVARELKNWSLAWTAYDQARKLLGDQPANANRLEMVLITLLDISEAAKDEKLESLAYDLYIQQTPKKTKLFEVQYQKAHRLYENGNYQLAATELRKLALDAAGPIKIRKQAADLSLDALVLLKDESTLAAWATDYAAVAPDWSKDFSEIVQKSVLTKAASAAATPVAAYAELAKFNPSLATDEDKIKFYKNKLILGEKLNKFSDAQMAADLLLAQKNLSPEDREFAWARKAYMAEMTLDFAGALAATEKLQTTLKPDEKVLKMAIFAELSGQKSSAYYSQYLQNSRDEENKKLVAAELVRKSQTPEKDLEIYKPILGKSPQLMAQLYTETFAKTSNEGILKKVAKDGSLKATDSGKLLSRVAFLKEFSQFKTKLLEHKLDSKNDRKLAASIKARISLLEKLESYTKQAIDAADFTSQLVTLDLLAKESERFYNDLLSAPMPAGLSEEEQQQYMTMLSAQATPFQAKSLAAKTKVEEFWKNAHWATALKNSWQQADLRSLILVEVNALREIAPETAKASLAEFAVDKANAGQLARPSVQEIQQARSLVYQNPFDKNALRALLDLEKKSENAAMSQYLQNRLETLQKAPNAQEKTL